MMNHNVVSSTGVHNSIANTITINTSQLNAGMNGSMMSDGMSEPSSPDSSFDASDLMGPGGIGDDDVTAQLVNSGNDALNICIG